MSKKKKTSAKQTKPNLQKPSAKPAKDAPAPKKNAPETVETKESATKAVKAEVPQLKEKKPEPSASKPTKSDTGKTKTEPSGKSETHSASPAQTLSKPEQTAKKQSDAKSEPKQPAKDDNQQPVEIKKKEETKPASKSQKGGKSSKKKDKTPRQSVESETEPAVSAVEVQELAPFKPADQETDFSPGREASEGEPASAPVTSVAADAPADASQDAPASGDAPRKVAKTLLEVNIGGLKEATAKATNQPPQREVAKTLMDASIEVRRDSLEASAKAIEDEIAAAIRESESVVENSPSVVEPVSDVASKSEPVASAPPPSQPTAAEQMVAEAAKNPGVKPADRKIAKTMLDFRADEFFELANTEIDTLVDDPAPEPASSSAPAAAAPAPAEPPAVQPRKVAKTMLEVDVPNIQANVQAAQAQVSQAVEPEPVAQEPIAKRRSNYDDVSMEDLNEFAQALKEDKPMSARQERLRKTFLGIRKHGLASSASMAGVGTTGETKQPQISAADAPVRVSRSLHPLDNFSFDDVCPAEDNVAAEAAVDAAPAAAAALHDESQAKSGTVELDHNQHEAPPAGEFTGVSTVWPHDQEQQVQVQQQQQQEQLEADVKAGTVKPERFVARTMLDMDFLKESLSASVSRAEEKLAESIAQKASEPPKQTLTSDDYKLAQSKCPFVWADGDLTKDRVRYCTQCSSQVYNFAGFDMAEAQALIFKRENRENAPLYKREDGKFMTNDCPIAVKKHKDKTMLIGGALLALILLVIMVIASFLSPQPPPAPAPTVDSGAPTAPATDRKSTDKSSSTTTTSAPTKDAPGAYHYVRGKGVVKSQPIVVPPPAPEDTSVPGTTSGYDEGGQFWQYTDKSNN